MSYTFNNPYTATWSFSSDRCKVNKNFLDELRASFGEAVKPAKKSFYDDDVLDYLLKDIMKDKAKEVEETLKKEVEKKKRKAIDKFANETIKNVYFNDPYTVIIWKDGTKTIVKCQPGDVYDKEKGFALAILKHLSGDTNYFNTIFKKWLPEEN